MNKRIDEIYSSSAGRQVLGSIIQKPELLKTHQLQASDFVDAPNQIIFMAIDYIARSGATQIDPFEVGEYLKQNYSYFYKVFEKHNGIEFLKNVAALSKPENFEYYYTELKRYTVLRVASQMGFDVSEFCDPDEIDLELEEKKRKFLEEFNPSGLVQYFETKVSELRDKAGVASVSDLNFYRISNLPLSQAEDKYLIQDFMLENTFNSIIAAAKVGKSQLAYQMAFCVQNGIDFLQYPVQKGDVLYVDFELRPNAIKKRFERLKEFYGLPDAEEYKVLSLADSYGEGSISLELYEDHVSFVYPKRKQDIGFDTVTSISFFEGNFFKNPTITFTGAGLVHTEYSVLAGMTTINDGELTVSLKQREPLREFYEAANRQWKLYKQNRQIF